jgi:hypothetical protein
MSEKTSAGQAGSGLSRRQFVVGSAASVLAAVTLVPDLGRADSGLSLSEGYDLWKFAALRGQGFYIFDRRFTFRYAKLVDVVVRSEAPAQFKPVFQTAHGAPIPEGLYNLFNWNAGTFKMRLSPGGEDAGGHYCSAWVSLLS